MYSTPQDPARINGSSTGEKESERITGIIVAFAAHNGFSKGNAVVEFSLALPLDVNPTECCYLNVASIRASVVALHGGRSIAASGRAAGALHLRNGSRGDENDTEPTENDDP